MAWEGAQEALKLVEDRRLLGQRNWMYRTQWYLNLQFYVGNQWVQWDPQLRAILQPPQDPDRPRVTENKIQPIVRQAVGKLTRQKLRQICPPAATGEESVDQAKVRTKLLEHLRRVTSTDYKVKSLAFWAALTGNGFARYQFDEDAGPLGRNGQPQGEIAMEVVSPFSIIQPPGCLRIEDMPWIIEQTTQSVAWVKEHHGVEVSADATTNAWDAYDAKVLDFTSAGAFINTGADAPTTDEKGKQIDGGQCRYVMYWERPTKAHENGRLIIVAGGQVVYPQTAEEAAEGVLIHSPMGDLPYNHLRWFDTGFRFLDMGLVECLVPLQRERNGLATDIREALRYAARAGWIAPKGAVKKDEWSAEAGSINEYVPVGGSKPEPVAPRAISSEFFQRIEKIDSDMADISGIHFRPAANMRAAAAFALQQESDNTLAEPVADNLEHFLVRDGQLKLRLARAHYGKGRTLRVTGRGMQWEVMEFEAALMGDGDDVEIQNSGQLAQDKTQRLGQVLQLLSAKDAKGQPVIDAYEARRLLDLENSENIDSQVHADMTRARYENSQLDAGKAETIVVNRWDNHDVHLREHYTRMKRIDFDQLQPAIRDAYMAHTAAHEQAKAAAAMAPPGQPLPPRPGGMQEQLPGQQGLPGQSAQLAQAVMPQPPSNEVQAGLRAGLTHVSNVVGQANQ